MDNLAYEQYTRALSTPEPSIFPPVGDIAEMALRDSGGYSVDKSYAQLKAMYDKSNLHGLKWHTGGDTDPVIMVPLTSAEADAFVFSVMIGTEIHVFTINSDDTLDYEERANGGGGSAMQVVPLSGGYPDVATPDPSIVYLTEGASASDPYDRWVYSDGTWTNIGTTDVALSDYYSKEDFDTMLGGATGLMAFKE